MNTLLVIGNGFDLSAQAKTSYSDFFNSEFYQSTRKSAADWIKQVKIDTFLNANMGNYQFNCWDLFFCLWESENQESLLNANWCDIEKEIHDSLVYTYHETWFSWDELFLELKKYFNSMGEKIPMGPSNNYYFMLAFLLKDHWKEACINERRFYERLLNDLIAFEQKFGEYIEKETGSDEYNEKATRQINLLVDDGSAVQIDSFNYSSFTNVGVPVRHVNGDCDNPIFGVDLTGEELESHPEIRRFTKTSRRVQQDAHHITADELYVDMTMDSAIIYGHSLNRMDFDYFNYLFTLLRFNTFDIEKMGRVEFVYKIYDSEKADEIRNNYVDAIYDVLNSYEKYVSKINQSILINLLRFSGKLRIRELEKM